MTTKKAKFVLYHFKGAQPKSMDGKCLDLKNNTEKHTQLQVNSTLEATYLGEYLDELTSKIQKDRIPCANKACYLIIYGQCCHPENSLSYRVILQHFYQYS